MDATNKEERFENPRVKANIFEILTFSWTLNVFKTGFKRDIEEKDLYKTFNDHSSSLLGSELEKKWNIELKNAKKKNRTPSLTRVLFQIFGTSIMFNGLIQMFVEVILRMSQPLLISGLLTYFHPQGSNIITLKYAYFYATCLMLSILSNILLFHYFQIEMLHCGMKMRVACCTTIFKKALRLSNTSTGETTVGQVVNLLTNDANRFDISMIYLHYLWIGPLATIVATYFLWQEIGIASLIGIFSLLMFIPLQGWLGKKTSEFRVKIAPRTDERIRLMDEIISGMQVIKMYTWEKPFSYLVRYSRMMEVEQLKGTTYTKVILESFSIFHYRVAIFMSIIVYILFGNIINTEKVYIIVTYFYILISTMTLFFPRAIGLLAELLVSIERIQSFLLSHEKDEQIPLALKENENVSFDGVERSTTIISDEDLITTKPDNQNNIKHIDDFGINVSNICAKWNTDQQDYSLNNVSLTVEPGRLVTIIGPVGAGKSSLIQAILRELPLSSGNILVRGVVSYASQEPWLFNSSVKQNILFGLPMDEERYAQVVNVCSLKKDYEQLPFGDKTIVGERGVSLSGGQRARINLARAVYKQADIYLLDDPLSAVDTRVGKDIFERCITDFLREKTCILITHQIQYLMSVDQIVLMENGSISIKGSYQKLQLSGLDFTKLLSPEKKPITSDSNKSKSLNSILEDPVSIPILSERDSINKDLLPNEETTHFKVEKEPTQVAEIRSSGNVSYKVYLSYILSSGNICKISFLLFICVITQILGSGGDYWISYWVNLEDYIFRNAVNVSTSNSSSIISGTTDTLFLWTISRQTCILVYTVIIMIMIVTVVIRCYLFVSFFMESSLNLHNNMFSALTRAKMYFFYTNSSGQILNRFSKDMGSIDEILPSVILNFVNVAFIITGILVIVVFINPFLIIPTLIMGTCTYYIIVYYLSSSRSTKRLEGVLRSPVIAHLNVSLQGITTIRAFNTEEVLSKEFEYHQDLHSSAWYLFISTSEAFGFSLDIICLIYLCILTYSFLFFYNDTYSGNVGLILTQAMNLTGALQFGVRQSAELENQMTSVERVLEYTNISPEAALEFPQNKKLLKEWPDEGKIVFQNFFLRYDPDTPYVLKNLNIRIQAMEKVGIVGRTGAGKSSLIAALFRLAFNEGNIIIDNVEIHELGLHELRSKISIIPQEPVLFSGTVRNNLDPFDEFHDHVLWNALDEVKLKNIVENLPDGLNSKMSPGGSNFSVGQRQLVCLARAIARNNKIIILDEATANIDSQTDSLIQNTIRNKFRTCTVLTIAHRLNTVMDSDKVLVMDAGTMVEFDHPYNLLKNENGFLYKMVEQTGRTTVDFLHNLATESYKSMQTARDSPIKLIDEDADEVSNETKSFPNMDIIII